MPPRPSSRASSPREDGVAESRDIFIVCDHITGFGDVPRWAHSMGAFFAERGHRVHLIGLQKLGRDHRTDLPYGTTTLYPEHMPAPWHPSGLGHLNVRRRLGRRRWEAECRAAAGKLSALFRSARPGGVVIVAQVWAMEWVARADRTGLRVIGMDHASYEAAQRSSRYPRIKRLYADVDRFLVLTDEDADTWARDDMSTVDVMPNPVMIAPTRLPTLDDPTVVTIGRLDDRNGIDMLLDAWAMVVRAHPEWRLKVYGSGPDEAQLRAQARELGLDPDAIFPGVTDDLEGALTSSSIFVLPSRDEGLPIAVMDAMAYGLPTAAFDCAPGVRELLGDQESGLLNTTGDVPGLAASLERLMKDPDLRRRLGANARESVRRFSPDTIVDRWENLFEMLER
jgi:glycosyltransferase involved in cell wall biosynthesis